MKIPLHVHILEPNYSVYSIKRHDIAQQRYISFLPIAHFSTIRFKKLVKLFFHSPTYFEVSPKLPYTRKRENPIADARDRFPPLKRKAKFTARNLSFG